MLQLSMILRAVQPGGHYADARPDLIPPHLVSVAFAFGFGRRMQRRMLRAPFCKLDDDPTFERCFYSKWSFVLTPQSAFLHRISGPCWQRYVPYGRAAQSEAQAQPSKGAGHDFKESG